MIQKLQRINRYFVALTDSFSIMVDGMEPEQFQKFRMSLLPASGFQSAQYRSIEIYSKTLNKAICILSLLLSDKKCEYVQFYIYYLHMDILDKRSSRF
jgi:tryptophan 2,3-dioxygenase